MATTWQVQLPRTSTERGAGVWSGAAPVDTGETLIIANPNARGFSPRRLDLTRLELVRRFGMARCVVTATEEAASSELAEALQRGAKRIISIGGDGTMNLVLNALRGHDDVQLGVVPFGTANDLAAEIGSAAEGRTIRRLDVLSVDGHALATTGGLGIAADVAVAVKEARRAGPRGALVRAMGPLIYPLVGAHEILGRREPLAVDIEFEDFAGTRRSLRGRAATLLVCNQRRLGGVLRVNENSEPDDGVFELVLVPDRGRTRLLATLARMAAGRLRPCDVETARARRAWVRTSRPTWFFGDGEPLRRACSFELGLHAQAQEFLC